MQWPQQSFLISAFFNAKMVLFASTKSAKFRGLWGRPEWSTLVAHFPLDHDEVARGAVQAIGMCFCSVYIIDVVDEVGWE